MAINRALDRTAMTAAQAQLARVEAQGCVDHPHRLALMSAAGPAANRDLADCVHLFCSLYGRYPGLIEIALNNCPAGAVRDWLRDASDAYERERLYLVRLTASVGPLPSTPGAAETEAALVSQRHAIETLAKSERRGCALGAATALMGHRAAMACTVAVEEAIDEHYQAQEAALGDDEAALRGKVEQFRAEELEHRDTGLAHEAELTPGYRVLSAAIKAGCKLAIKVSERV